jgi:glycosyltransferase involved in cell wall biosynthesis
LNNNIFLKERGVRKINPFFYVINDIDIKPYLKNIKPVVYFTLPDHIKMVKQYNPSLIVFDSIDEPTEEFSAWGTHYYSALENSHIVLATSHKLYNKALEINPETHLVPNGCDYHFFNRASKKTLEIPEDMRSIKRPIIGFIGAVSTWCDFELIGNLARSFPDCSIVMVGPYLNVNELPKHANLYWLGGKPYEQLASYAQLFDVGIIPFRVSSMIESVNPIKMWEYMAVGMPVVTTALPEVLKYSDLLLYSEDQEQFIENIKIALYNDTLQKRQQRMKLAWQNSWKIRAQKIKGIIENKLIIQDNVITKTDTALKRLIETLNNMPDHIRDINSINNVRIGRPGFRYSTDKREKKRG